MQEILEQPEVLKLAKRSYQELKKGLQIKGKKVYLFGTGASLSACMQAKYSFLKYAGFSPTVVPACEATYYLEILDSDSCVIIVSQSGESYETKVICERLLEKNIMFIAITNQTDSFLGRHASICFPLNAKTELGTATKTQTSSVMLLYEIAVEESEEAQIQLQKIPDMLLTTIETAREYVAELAEFIGVSKVVYLTGLDAQAPTALQASLMLKEKVWLHAEGLSLAEFRHGPVEVLEKEVPVILIGYGEVKRETLLLHANFLTTVCHAKVVLVTDCTEKELGGYRNFPYIWDGDEELSHICATAPFQVLAEYMARVRNYDIDGFKYIGKILNQYEKAIE